MPSHRRRHASHRARSRGARFLAPVVLAVVAFVAIGSVLAAPAVAPSLLTPVNVVTGAADATSGQASTLHPIVRTPDETPDDDDSQRDRPGPSAALPGYQWPLPNGRITQAFGRSAWGSRIVDGQHFHDGVDMATFCGDRIVAAHSGTVLAAGRRFDAEIGWVGDLKPYFDRLDRLALWSTLPITVIIDDGNGYRSIYAHFQKVVVKKGQIVRAGQFLGYEGATGRASGCHLHYGLFSPLESGRFGIDPDVVKRMKVPTAQIARVDPLLVLPQRLTPTPTPQPSADPGASSPAPLTSPELPAGATGADSVER